MAGAWTTVSIKDGGGTSRTMRAWDESGTGAGPYSFGQVAADGSGSGAIAAVKAGSTPAASTDAAQVVVQRDLNSNGRATPALSAPVVLNSQTYETVAASQTAQVLGGAGASTDYIDSLLVIPTSTSPGSVTLIDNATSIVVFAGGASSLSNLIPFCIPLGMIGGPWKITTGAGLSVIGIGNFT
jgi:hypothetical protein